MVLSTSTALSGAFSGQPRALERLGVWCDRALPYLLIMEQTTAFMLRESEVAARLRVSVATLRRLRQRGTGPEWVRIGKQIRYPVSGCERWLEANLGRTLPKHWRAVGGR
jgi:predicted DNA-binding transcriptional regulator AlpA